MKTLLVFYYCSHILQLHTFVAVHKTQEFFEMYSKGETDEIFRVCLHSVTLRFLTKLSHLFRF